MQHWSYRIRLRIQCFSVMFSVAAAVASAAAAPAPPPVVERLEDEWMQDGNFVIRHHARSRHHLYDPDDDALGIELATKRVSCGVTNVSGIPFRLDDRWTDGRPYKPDEVHKQRLSAKERIAKDIERHPHHTTILSEGWTGIVLNS